MQIAFFPKAGDLTLESHHYTKLKPNGKFKAWLPAGEYMAVLIRRENVPIAYNGFDVTVEANPDLKLQSVTPLTAKV